MKFILPLIAALLLTTTLQAQISNDDCHSASVIALAPEGYGQMYSGYYAMATASYVGGNSCSVPPAEDFWYKFVATSTTLKLTNNITNGSSALLTLYKNSCYNLEEIHCQQSTITHVPNLTIGNLYYLKVQKQGSSSVFFSFKAEEGINDPNGLCEHAELVTVDQGECTTSHYFSTVGESGVARPSCVTGDVFDVWFQVVAPPSGCIEIIENGGNPLRATSYTNDCNSLIELDCSSSISSDPYLPGFTPGETYLIRLHTSTMSSIVYDVCFKEGPMTLVNDECSNSTTISVPSSCSDIHEENLRLATISPESGCTGYSNENEDIWYNFIAPATGSVVIQNWFGPSFFTALYEGVCGNLTELYCPNASLGEFAFNQLTPGSTYTLRIARVSSTSNVRFCVYEGEASPPEDECASAIALTVQTGTCNNTQSINWSFLTSSGEDSPCTSADETDAWFSFTAPASGNIEFSGLNNADITKTIYSGSCGSLVPEVCVKGKYVSGLIPNESYILLLSRAPSASTFYFCLLEYTIGSINNTCSNATLLSNNSTFVPSWNSAAFEEDSDNTCEFRPHDLWYSFVAPASGAVKFSGPSGNSKSIEIYEGACGSLSQISCLKFQGAPGNTIIVGSLNPGSTYYGRVYDPFHDNHSTQTLSFNDVTATVNNDCEDATAISPSSECSTFFDFSINFTNASLSNVPLPDCTGSANYVDLWYSFDAPSSGVLQFEDSGILGYVAVYENSCGALNQIYCGSANTSIIDSLIPDTTYLLRIISTTRNSTSFCLVKQFPEDNSSSCESPASGILFGDNECGPLVEFDMSENYHVESDLCGGDYEQWYEFQAPPSGSFNFQLFQGSNSSNIAIYDGTCENLSELFCMPLGAYESKLINGLVGGQTYLLRYSTLSPYSEVKFCVSEVSPPSEESTCTEALEILESSDDACDQIISGSTLGAGESAGAFCGNNYTNAVFYTFTPEESASYSIVVSNAAASHRITVFENCALQSPINCGLMETIASFMGGTTYVIAIYPEINSIRSTFDLCVFKPDPALMSGSVGINVPNPQTRLDVNGGIKPGYSEEMLAGNIRWSTDLEVYDGTSWKSLIGWDYQATEDINMVGHKIKNLSTPITPNDAATKEYVDNHVGSDSDPTNEIQTISKAGSTVTLSDGGGNFTDDVDDADNDPTNEIETWSTLAGIPSGFLDDVDNVDDADNDPTNEIETWSTLAGIPADFADDVDNVDDADNDPTNEIETWSTLAGIPSGFSDGIDHVNDADASPSNELQTISKAGNVVTLSNSGGSFIDEVNDDDDDPTNEIETWSTLAGIPSGFLDGIDDGGAFTRNGTLVVNAGNHDLEDFAFGSNSLPTNSNASDTLFFFDKSKGAFRSGRVFSSKVWAPDSIGLYSFATGSNVSATGNSSFAGGVDSKVSGAFAVGLGYSVDSHGESSTAFGYKTDAIGDYSLAIGNSTIASGTGSSAFGSNTTASGSYTTSIGLNTIAAAYGSVTLGRYNVGGGNMTSWVSTDPLFEIGIGTSGSNKMNAIEVLKNGTVSFKSYTFPLNDGSANQYLGTDGSGNLQWQNGIGAAFVRVGQLVKTNGYHDTDDFLFGSDNLPNVGVPSDTLMLFDKSKGAFRAGGYNSNDWVPDSIGIFSVALGNNARASGDYSAAIGYDVKATKNYSIAIGNSEATAQGAVAIGSTNTHAGGVNSIALIGGEAMGGNSMAIGLTSHASGSGSFSNGYNSLASGQSSVAFGDNTSAEARQSFVIGRYNIGGGNPTSWISTDPLLEVGIGTSSTASNALTILKNGNVGIGTHTPDVPLVISSNGSATIPQLKLTESVANDGARIIFSNGVETDNRWTLYGLADNTDANSVFNIFYNGVGNMLTANGLGNIGIKCDPDADFHIRHSNSGGSGGLKLQNSTNDEFARLYVSSGDGNLRLYFDTTGLKGTFNDVNGVYSTVSDRRLKNNFQDLAFDWHSFNQLTPLTYTYNNDAASKRYIGMVAQDVLEIYPQLITYVEEEDRYTMDYSGFGVIAVKAIQEQQKIIEQQAIASEEQQKTIEELRHQNHNLASRLEELERQNINHLALEARLTTLENKQDK